MPKRTWTVEPGEAGQTLDKFLASPDRLGSRSRAAAAREKAKVQLNDTDVAPGRAVLRLRAGDRVQVWDDRPGSARKRPQPFVSGDLRIVYEDDAVIVIDKPAGVLAVPLERREGATSVYEQLVQHMRSRGKRKPFVVHRIDRDTSGLVLFAKDRRSQAILRQQFRERTPARVYLAVVYGTPEPSAGTWRDHLVWDAKALIQKQTHPKDPRAAEAVSHYNVVERLGPATLIEIRLHTGKRNQIRLQARLRGHTLVGESRYTYGSDDLRPIAFRRQALHAWRLAFRHPADGREIRFEAPLPSDMNDLLTRLRRAQSVQRQTQVPDQWSVGRRKRSQ